MTEPTTTTVALTQLEHDFIWAMTIPEVKPQKPGDWKTLTITNAQRELIAGRMREFLGRLTQKIPGRSRVELALPDRTGDHDYYLN